MPWINNRGIRQCEELAANSPDQSGMISAGKIGSPNAAAKKNIAAKNSDLPIGPSLHKNNMTG